MTQQASIRHPLTRVGIVAKAQLASAGELLTEIGQWLRARGIEPFFETNTAALAGISRRECVFGKRDLPRTADLILVLGGDGTLLGVADCIAEAAVQVPILGVNFGRLGFLTEITLQELYDSLEDAIAGTAILEPRLMLRSQALRNGSVAADRFVLNDVVVTRNALSRIIDMSVWIDDQFVADFLADGLLVATPTGSTAYNLSSGGPILHPAVDAFVLTPIAPHILTNRPIVIDASAEIRIKPVLGDDDQIFVSFDGQFGIGLRRDDVIRVVRAPSPAWLVRATKRSYFEVLRQKLKWTER